MQGEENHQRSAEGPVHAAVRSKMEKEWSQRRKQLRIGSEQNATQAREPQVHGGRELSETGAPASPVHRAEDQAGKHEERDGGDERGVGRRRDRGGGDEPSKKNKLHVHKLTEPPRQNIRKGGIFGRCETRYDIAM